MSSPVLLALAGVLVAAVVTGVVAGRCVRAPSVVLGVWAVAAVGLAIAAAAEAIGFAAGFSASTFRAIAIGGQLIAPLWLAWGLAELTAGEAARFGARLISMAITVVAGLILATDTLTGQAFTKNWPAGGAHYQSVSHYVLLLAQIVAGLGAVVIAVVTVMRVRNGTGWAAPVPAVVPVAAAVVLAECLRFSLPARSVYPLVTALAAGLLWFGVSRSGLGVAGSRNRDRDRAGGGERGDTGRGGTGRGGTGRGDTARGDTARGGSPMRPGSPGLPGPQDRPAPQDRAGAGRGYGPGGPGGAEHRPGADYYRPGGPGAGRDYGGWVGPGGGPGFGPPPSGPPGSGSPGWPGAPGPPARLDDDPLTAMLDSAAAAAAGPPARPYGRILIFTLLDERVAEFDELAERTAEEVRTGEPDTLVYVIHLVPNAPLQRIFYEIYRDRAAFDRHEDKPYIKRFTADRRAYVLATNVIELRVKYAKVAPLPQVEPSAAGRAALPAGGQRSLPPGTGPASPGVLAAGGALAAGLVSLPSMPPPMGASMPNPLPPPAPVPPSDPPPAAGQRRGGR